MSLMVLDASVAAKWFLPRRGESLVEEAFAVLGRHSSGELELAAPDLFWAELGYLLWKAVRIGRWSAASAAAALGLMREQRLETVPSRDLLEDALAIAIETGRTVYDSLYVALAVRERAEVVTADERLANALAARWPVKWLGTFW